MKKLLFLVLIISSSLFSATTGDCVETDNGSYELGNLDVSKTSIGKTFDCSPNNYIFYPDSTTSIYTCSSFTGPDANGNYTLYDYKVYGKGAACSLAPTVTCADNEIYDSNTSSCVPFFVPDSFPSDANASHGTLSNGILPIPETDCNSASTPDMSTSLGAYHVVGWDTSTSTCKAMAFKCNSGLVYDAANKTCIVPPTELADSNTEQDNACAGKFVQRLSGTLNFCNQCGFSLGYWRPPLGYEDYGLQCDHSYIEYACTTDYRIKRFVEVSCGDPLPQDMTTKELDLSNLDTNVKDTNVSSVVTDDSSSNQIEAINQLKNINSSILATNQALDGLTNIANDSNAKLGTIDSKLGSIDGNVKAIKDGLFQDGTLPDMSNYDTDVSSMLDNVTTAIDNFKSDVDNAINEINSKKALIENGFSFTYTKERVTNCPITKVFDMGAGGSTSFDIDYCESLSQFYDVGYLIAYVSAVSASLAFIYLIVVGL